MGVAVNYGGQAMNIISAIWLNATELIKRKNAFLITRHVRAFSNEPGNRAGRDEFCCLFVWEILARSTGMEFKNQNQNGRYKPVSFLAVAVL